MIWANPWPPVIWPPSALKRPSAPGNIGQCLASASTVGSGAVSNGLIGCTGAFLGQ